MEQIRRIMRPTDVPDTGLLCDLLWSDPDKDVQGWGENDRGVSFTFGADIVTKFLNRHDLDLICRAHQVVEDGYEFFAKRQLVTLFSAPNYCGEFDNAGGMMSVDDSLMCSFQVVSAFCYYLSDLNHFTHISDSETIGKESKIPIPGVGCQSAANAANESQQSAKRDFQEEIVSDSTVAVSQLKQPTEQNNY